MASNQRALEGAVSRLAGLVAIIVSLAPPAVFAWYASAEAGARLEVEAMLQARALTGFVGRNPAAWHLPTDRLRALLDENRTREEGVRVLDWEGEPVVVAAASADWPVMTRRAEFHDYGRPVGAVEVSASARGILYRALGVLGMSALLGLVIYGPLRRIPLRAFATATRDLKASEARYRLLVERAPVGIVSHRAGHIEFANPAFVTMVGVGDAGELIGRDFLEFVAPEHRGDAAAMIVMLSGRGESLPVKRLRLQRGGEPLAEVEVVGISVPEGDGWITQLVFLDVTEQRRSQELIRASRDRLLAQQQALLAVTRGAEFSTGDCDAMVRSLTEAAAKQQGVERVSLWRFTGARDGIVCLDLYELTQDRHSSGATLGLGGFPRYRDAMLSEEVIVADDAIADELTRELADSYLRPLGIASMLDVPVRLRGVTEGVLCHEHVGAPVSWTLEQRLLAISMGNLAALAFEREARLEAEKSADALRTVVTRRVEERGAGLEEGMRDLASFSASILQDREIQLEEVDLGALARQSLAQLDANEPRRVECLVRDDLEVRCDWLLMQVAMERLVRQAWKGARGNERPRIEIGEARVDGERAFFVSDNRFWPDGTDAAESRGRAGTSFGAADSLRAQAGMAVATSIIARHGGRVWCEAGPEGAVIWFTLEPPPNPREY